jgi:predicted nucleic acid-binding protein
VTRRRPASSQKGTASKTVVDSWAWVELFKASEAGRIAKERIQEADDVFTPSLVLAELARKYLLEGEEPSKIHAWLRAISEASQVVEIDIGLAEESARASIELVQKAQREGLRRPGLVDAIVLATSRVCRAELLTGDPHFKGLSRTSWIG